MLQVREDTSSPGTFARSRGKMGAIFKMAGANVPGGSWPKTYKILSIFFLSDQGVFFPRL